MKKSLSLLLLACFLLSFFSACSKPSDIFSEEDDSLNFLGGTIRVYMFDWTGQVESFGGSASSDREYQRILDTQDKFNFTFDYIHVDSIPNTFLSGALSGGLRADLIKASPADVYGAYAIDTLIPAENIVNDISSQKWQAAGQDGCGVFNGKRYSVFPYLWESSPTISGFININMTILDEYGIPAPHDIIEAGEWDWNHFTEFLRQTAFTDGTTVWRGLGMYASAGETMLPFILGNGGSYMTNWGGKYKLAIDSEEAIEALKFAQSLVAEDIMSDIPADNTDFHQGMTWMLASGSVSTSDVYDLSAIRYPFGPHGNKDIVSTITNGDLMYAFPIFSGYNEDEIGTVVEFMFEPLSDIYPNGWRDLYEDNVFFYHEDYEYYLRSVENATYLDNAALHQSYFDFRGAMRLVLFNSATPEAAVESVYDIIQADIDEHYNK